MVLSLLVQRFDVSFSRGYNPKDWEDEMQEYFVAEVGRLPVTLSLRR